ncbi:MAG: adenosylhomocysteinase [Solirubrobacterales bacterium]
MAHVLPVDRDDPQPRGLGALHHVLDEVHTGQGARIRLASALRASFDALGFELTKLKPEQAACIGVPVEGPYKGDHYRY